MCNENDIIEIILGLANNLKYRGLMLNERYLHHKFSFLVQNKFGRINLTQDNSINTFLHPEWPTYKKQTGLKHGKYKKDGGTYQPCESGTAGFIDFAIGSYDKPEIGLEFSLKYNWHNEEVVYDFVKLLDSRNPFSVVISFNVIFRKNGLTKGKYLNNLEEKIKRTIPEAKKRLKRNICDSNRKIYFIISEIDSCKRRHWFCDNKDRDFKEGLPENLQL